MSRRKREIEKAKKQKKRQKQRQLKQSRQQHNPQKWVEKRTAKNAATEAKREFLQIPYNCPLPPAKWPGIGQECSKCYEVRSCPRKKISYSYW